MSWNYLTELADADTVRDRLPIDYVLAHLFNETPNRGRKVHCINPDHNDSTPSMHLWSPENEVILTHVYCLGCSWKGDVLDIIDMYYEDRAIETISIGMQMVAEYENAGSDSLVPRVRNGFSQQSLELAWREFCTDSASDAMISAFLIRKQLIGKLPMEWCRDSWRWRGSTRNRGLVAMPHFTSRDTLTGVKFRSALKLYDKDGLDWSQYPELYGAWRDTGHKHIAICEGESDAVYGSYLLQASLLDVMGIPTGVAQNPTPAMKTMLADRHVHLIFDADNRGREGRDRWQVQLQEISMVSVHDLTEGDDLCTYRGNVVELLGEISD